MREIKFRAWDKEEERIRDWKNLLAIGYGPNKIMDSEIDDSIFNDTDLELMQFTGLKDRNGKEIFEGDILSNKTNYAPYKCVMVWSDELGSCGCCYDHCDSVGFVGKILPGTSYNYSTLASEYDKMEIIGNIYETPELLREDQLCQHQQTY